METEHTTKLRMMAEQKALDFHIVPTDVPVALLDCKAAFQVRIHTTKRWVTRMTCCGLLIQTSFTPWLHANNCVLGLIVFSESNR